MERARNNKRKWTKRKSGTSRDVLHKVSSSDSIKKTEYKSLKELFTIQQQKWDAKFTPHNFNNQSSHLVGDFQSDIEPLVICIADDDNDNADSVQMSRTDTVSNTTKSNGESSAETEIIQTDPSFQELFDEDDSLFSNVDLEQIIKDKRLEESTEPHTSSQSSPNKIQKIPYYVENFITVIRSITEDSFFSYLFNSEDKSVINIYLTELNLPQQQLYSRLFMRKFRWLRRDQISYHDINKDISNVLSELVDKGLLCDSGCLVDLNEALKCMSANELKQLAKSFQINSSQPKHELIQDIENHSKKISIVNFFAKQNCAMNDVVINRAKSYLESCYKLQADKRSTFLRIMMLSALSNTVSDDDFSGQQQIFQMLQTSIGLTKYPSYVIHRKSKIFQDRQSLIRYVDVLELESRLWQKMERKKYEDAHAIYKEAKLKFEDCLVDPLVNKFVASLPLHLRIFSVGAAYVRILSRGVSVLQFLKLYDEAVIQLKELLSQSTYHQDYRGRWYDRITLDLDFHLKQPAEAMQYIISALSDPYVRTGHRLDILHRAKKILAAKTKKFSISEFKDTISNDVMNFIQKAPSITINGQQLPKSTPAAPSLWVVGKENFDVMTRVEQFALEYYADAGYPEGTHGEGLTLTCLFSILCWDIIYADSYPDVFYNYFQISPLDLRTDDFYEKRKAKFIERFKLIASSSTEELEDIVDKCWLENHGTLCAGLDWTLFRDVDHMKGLVKCFGGRLLSGVLDRMAQQMRYVTGGVPDLIVWNPKTVKIKFVEVKGPGDKLSSKQILWLDYLLALGADAEVCHVKAESSKRLKPN